MERIILSEDITKGYPDDSMEAAQHFAEGFRILVKIIAREITNERASITKYENIGQDVRSKIVQSLQLYKMRRSLPSQSMKLVNYLVLAAV